MRAYRLPFANQSFIPDIEMLIYHPHSFITPASDYAKAERAQKSFKPF